jgi:mono/diheme cytochrome c family protein
VSLGPLEKRLARVAGLAAAVSGAASIALSGCGADRRAPATDRSLLDQGRAIFVSAGCGGCHTLSAAGTHGRVGPNFDRSETLNAAQIGSQLRIGAGGMPSFRDSLTPRQQAAVAAFLADAMRRRAHP